MEITQWSFQATTIMEESVNIDNVVTAATEIRGDVVSSGREFLCENAHAEV